jgi:toxin secretion/phage lysis holin
METAKMVWGAICAALSVSLSTLAQMFGGWDSGMVTLMMFMMIDYATGLIVAGVFHNSPKSEGGALESRAGWKGLIRKGCTLLFVLIATRLDMVMGTTVVRDGAIIGFLLNELVSIIENAGLMGIPLPKALTNAIELLKAKEDGKVDDDA